MLRWLRRQWLTVRRRRRPLTAKMVEDLPETIDSDHVYLVGDDGFAWSAAMVCPCGCQVVIQLSLIERDRPSWRTRIEPSGVITIQPSVWRTRGCQSHFFVRHGRVQWAKEHRTSEQ